MTPADSLPEWHHLPANPYNPHAWILGTPNIGEGCWIGAFTVIDGSGGLTIGNGCEISAGAQIYTHTTVARAVSAGSAPLARAPTWIGDHVHIGANAVVLMGTTIGDHSVIGANAVVLEGMVVPPWSVVVGPGVIKRDAARKQLRDQSQS